MKLITTDELLRQGETTRPSFQHYSKTGMLFSPDKKVKKRVREGTQTFYAEDILRYLKRLNTDKEKGLTLEEIKEGLIADYRSTVIELYRSANITLIEHTASNEVNDLMFRDYITSRVALWQETGFYRGRLLILKDILSLIVLMSNSTQECQTSLNKVWSDLAQAQLCYEDKKKVGIQSNKVWKAYIQKAKDENANYEAIKKQHDKLEAFLIKERCI